MRKSLKDPYTEEMVILKQYYNRGFEILVWRVIGKNGCAKICTYEGKLDS